MAVICAVSVAMKFHEARKVQITRNTKNIWRDKLVKFGRRIVFLKDSISELRSGLELGRLLELPFDLACNSQHLGDLLGTDSAVRPFSHLQ